MKQHSKLSAEQQQQLAAGQQSQRQFAREFASPEEMLRHDAAATKVPPGIAQRLAKSAGAASGSKRSWWKRLFES